MAQPTTSSQEHGGPTAPVTSGQPPTNGHIVGNSTPPVAGVETDGAARTAPSLDDFVRVQAGPEFQELRRRMRRFVFPMTGFFLAWYLVYMLLATYAHDFMAIRVVSNINLGVVLGFGQFVTTFAITLLYVKFAGRTLDPKAAQIRNELEGAGQ